MNTWCMVQVKKRLGSNVKNAPPIEEEIYNRDLSYAVVGSKKIAVYQWFCNCEIKVYLFDLLWLYWDV